MIFSYLLTLFGVCGLAVGSLVLLRAAKSGGLALGGGQQIRVVARQSLGAGAQLMLVEIEGARMLVSVSRAGIVVHSPQKSFVPSEVEAPARQRSLDLARDERRGERFSATLRRAGTRW